MGKRFVRVRSGMLATTVAALGGAVYLDHHSYETGRQTLIQTADAKSVVMHAAPINPDWVTEGTPVTETGEVAHTYDGSTKVYIWRTTASKFKWIYDSDEVVTILDGDVFITDSDNSVRHLVAGDVALFPVGAVLRWNVPDHVVKSAIIKRSMPKPFETAMRWLRKARGVFAPEKTYAL